MDEPDTPVLAPTYQIPPTSYTSIEYPGPVASTSASQAAALWTLGGVERLSKAVNTDPGIVELNFRPDAPFSHALPGETSPASHLILLKVTKKRRRRRRDGDEKTKIVGERVVQEHGVYKVEAAGTIDKVVRFRGMADLQYCPQDANQDATVQLGSAIRNMNVPGMQQYRFPEPSEDFEGKLGLLPPPVFSRLTLPQIYAYRPNPLSATETVVRPDGSENTRLVNKAKYKGELTTAISFSAPASEVPTGPPSSAGDGKARAGLEPELISKLQKLFEERPVWTRVALLNQVTKHERSRIQNYKITLPSVSYTFSDGPFRESCIRFGYDPRIDRDARFYQRIMIRNMANKNFYLKKIAGAGAGAANGPTNLSENDENSHIFDGENVHRNIGNYQLCDMTDPYLREVILNDEFVRDTCDSRDGWWDGEYIEFIRQILRRKFFALINEGTKLPNEAFFDLVEHLHEWRAQQERLGNLHSGNDSRADSAAIGDASGAAEMGMDEDVPQGDQSLFAMRRLTSLKGKGKRSDKPKAKSASGQPDRARSRFSAAAEVPPGQDTEPEYGQEEAMEGDLDTVEE